MDCIMVLGACPDCCVLVRCVEICCWEFLDDAEGTPDGWSNDPIVAEDCLGLPAGSLFPRIRAAISLSLAACNITNQLCLQTTF
jgi:hypothetical protein